MLEQHLTEPVDFIGMVEAMYAAGARVFLEVGPKSVLTGLTRRILGKRPHCAVSMDGAGGGLVGLLHALAAIMVQGVRADLARLFEGRDLAPVDLADWGHTRPDSVERTANGWLLNGTRARPAHVPAKAAVVPTPPLPSRSAQSEPTRNAGKATIVKQEWARQAKESEYARL